MNLIACRAHCTVDFGLCGYSQFTQTRVFPVGVTFAQAAAITRAELQDIYKDSYGHPRCKVSVTGRPDLNAELELTKLNYLFENPLPPSSPIVPFWMAPE